MDRWKGCEACGLEGQTRRAMIKFQGCTFQHVMIKKFIISLIDSNTYAPS